MRDQLRSAQTLGAAILLVGAALVVGYRRQSSDSTAETSQHRQSRIKNAASHSIIQTSAVPENTSTTSPTSPPKSVNIPSTDTNMLGQPILITPPSPAPIKYVDVVEQSIDNYVLSDLLGKGMFSDVYMATHRLTGSKVAIKVITKMGTDESTLNQEIRAMKLIRGHPHVVTLFEVIEDEDKVYMVMDYCPNGTLDSYLMRHGKVTEKRARLWLHQLVDAVRHCHLNRVVNLDIKPANIYLDQGENLKLGDFGLSAVTIDAYTDEIKKPAGSPVYAAPEVYQGRYNAYVGPSAAMWSIGTVLHAMLSQALPFEVNGYPSESLDYVPPSDVSPEGQDLLVALLATDPSNRPTEEDIFRHPWMTKEGGACCCLCMCDANHGSLSPRNSGSLNSSPSARECRRRSVEHLHYTCTRSAQLGSDHSIHQNVSDTGHCVDRAKHRMHECGFTTESIENASRSTSVFDHAAATLSILLSSECRFAHTVSGSDVDTMEKIVEETSSTIESPPYNPSEATSHLLTPVSILVTPDSNSTMTHCAPPTPKETAELYIT